MKALSKAEIADFNADVIELLKRHFPNHPAAVVAVASEPPLMYSQGQRHQISDLLSKATVCHTNRLVMHAKSKA